jgi:hypothetical protein
MSDCPRTMARLRELGGMSLDFQAAGLFVFAADLERDLAKAKELLAMTTKPGAYGTGSKLAEKIEKFLSEAA